MEWLSKKDEHSPFFIHFLQLVNNDGYLSFIEELILMIVRELVKVTASKSGLHSFHKVFI